MGVALSYYLRLHSSPYIEGFGQRGCWQYPWGSFQGELIVIHFIFSNFWAPFRRLSQSIDESTTGSLFSFSLNSPLTLHFIGALLHLQAILSFTSMLGDVSSRYSRQWWPYCDSMHLSFFWYWAVPSISITVIGASLAVQYCHQHFLLSVAIRSIKPSRLYGFCRRFDYCRLQLIVRWRWQYFCASCLFFHLLQRFEGLELAVAGRTRADLDFYSKLTH